MNVLHINQDVSVKGGGVARMIREFAPYLKQGGATVYAATAEAIETSPSGIEEHVYMPDVQERKSEPGEGLIQVFHQYNIDVVHVHEVENVDLVYQAIDLAPTIIHLHNYGYWCPGNDLFYAATEERCPLSLGWKCVPNAYLKRCNNRHPKRLYQSIQTTYRRTALFHKEARFMVSSAYMKSRAETAGVPSKKISVLPYAVDLSRFDGDGKPPDKGVEPGYLLFVGRLAQSKGVSYLLKALSKLEDASTQLVIVGDGYYRKELERQVEREGLSKRVLSMGWQDGPDLSWLYQHASVVVVPSVWDEVFGIVGLEAMAASKPVVAFDVGGISQWLVDGETGYLVPPKDVRGLAQRISSLLNHPDRARSMGAAGRKRFMDNFTVQEQAGQLLSTYEATIENFARS